MRLLVHGSARSPRLVVALYLFACIVAAFGVARLQHEDDVLVFLPDDDDDVRLFRSVSDRFGSLRIAIVGVAVRGEGDVLAADRLARIDAATRAFASDAAFVHVTSLTNLTDVAVGPDGAVVDRLVPTRPRSDAEHAALRARVLAREMVVGTLITDDARATAIMVYLAPGIGTAEAVAHVRDIADRELTDFEVHLSGAPFDAEAIYGAAREDVLALSPVAALLLVAVILLSFRDFVSVGLTFATVGVAELLVVGAMGWIGERHTVLTSTLPILLLATGSAYAVHVLGRYYLERERLASPDALRSTAAIVSRPVAIAAWTTAAAFLAFLVMDVAPMRAFGLEVAGGTLVCWFTALTLIPAVLTLMPRPAQRERLLPLGGLMVRAWKLTERRRAPVLIGLCGIALLTALPLRDVEVKTEARAFLAEGSAAWEAQRFLEDRFGGSRFVQVLVEGDLQDPGTLRRVAMVAERASALPGVTSVSTPTDIVALTIDTLGGGRRLPATRSQAAAAFLLLDGTPELEPLLADDHRAALLSIRVRGEALGVVEAMESWIAGGGLAVDPIAREAIAARVSWLAASTGNAVDAVTLSGVLEDAAHGLSASQWSSARGAAALTFVRSEDAADIEPPTRARIEAELARGRDPAEALRSAITDPDDAAFYGELLERALVDARQQLAVARAIATIDAAIGLPDGDPRIDQRLHAIAEDLMAPIATAGDATVAASVTGEPALDRALSRSVARNQVRTMAVGLVGVFALLVILFRSLRMAFVCVAPAVLTAGLLGGLMGFFGVRIDLSTAMVGAIVTDTATDFGMHYLWYLRQQSPEETVRTVGPIMIVSNLLVALGFFAFTLGSSPVMHLFGSLSGATCVVSAVIACLLIPALWRWLDPSRARVRRDDRAGETLGGAARANEG